MIKKVALPTFATAHLLAGCTAAMDEKNCVPPDIPTAHIAIQGYKAYAESLWYNHYHTDEAKVPEYTLPQFRSRTVDEWEKTERPRILELFKQYMYGMMPPAADKTQLRLLAQNDNALDGLAIRKEYRVYAIMNNGKTFNYDLMVYIPKHVTKPPVFAGLNFGGNQANTPDKDVLITRSMYMSYKENRQIKPLSSRGVRLDSWNFKETIKRGYAVATACYWEICPDYYTGLKISAYNLFCDEKQMRLDHEIPIDEQKKGKCYREISSIGAWAWGLSSMLDALEQEPLVDAKHAAVIGHSRLGKAALWAGACDERFKLIISNNSGCGGAALSRRNFGETMEIGYWDQRVWYCGRVGAYVRNINLLPVDQHMLLALAAPRALYIASASEDLNADPKGEFLAAKEASKIWNLYGMKGLSENDMPPCDKSVGDQVGYHIRTGAHGITGSDWQHYYNFADKIFKVKK